MKLRTTAEDSRSIALQARLLAAGLSMKDIDPGNAIPREVIALAHEGQEIKAIKELRKARKLCLLEARRVVDEIGR
jgi:ribosomal protein L7/L12